MIHAFHLKDTRLFGKADIFLDRSHSVCLVFLIPYVPCCQDSQIEFWIIENIDYCFLTVSEWQ